MAQRLPVVCAALTGVAALSTLVGWAFGVEILRAMIPGRVAMNPATAIGLAAAAGALTLAAREERRALAEVLTLIVVSFGLLKLGSYLSTADTVFDRLLFTYRLEADTARLGQPNRMAPNTALSFVLIGSSLWLFLHRRLIPGAQVLALATGSIACSAMLGYAYGLGSLYRVSTFIPMALNSALAFAALALGALALRPSEGLVSVFTSLGAGGYFARRFLPAAIILPAVLGGVRLWGERAGLLSRESGLVSMVVLTGLLMMILVWWTARAVDRADRERHAALEAAEESSLFFESIFENLPLMGFVKDAGDLRFVKFNRAGEELVGFERTELLGRSDYDFFPLDQAEFFVSKDREVLAGTEPVDIPEEPIRTAQGTRLLHTRKVPLPGHDGRPRYILGISEDITERKLTDARVQQLNNEMEAFSYSVSHDLRAPLRAIVGFSQALLEGHAQTLDDDGRSLLGRIIAAGNRMARLIDELLAFSRLGRAEMSRREVDLSALAREIEQGLREAEPDREVDVDIADGLTARGDPNLLRAVMQNLLDNAWKYTGKGFGTRIEVGVVPPADGEAAAFFVKDDGAGFDMAYADKLFIPFQRLHSSHEFDGTGIGLATVHRIVQRHGGRVWAEGAVGKGATFFFTLEGDDRWMTN